MSSHIKALLRERYSVDEWVLAFEVAPETGGGTRRADAVAMNMWRSRGHAIHGFEFKVSRSDWLRELRDPSKADAVAQYCDCWWLVIDGDNIIKDDELPEGWGLIAVVRDKNHASKGLRVKVKAARRYRSEPEHPPYKTNPKRQKIYCGRKKPYLKSAWIYARSATFRNS